MPSRQQSKFLKKATGAAKAPAAAVSRKRHGLGRSVDFSGGVDGLLGAPGAMPVAMSAAQALELPIMEIERSPFQPRRDFNEEELYKAIYSYQSRQRRFGKTEAQVEEEEAEEK